MLRTHPLPRVVLTVSKANRLRTHPLPRMVLTVSKCDFGVLRQSLTTQLSFGSSCEWSQSVEGNGARRTFRQKSIQAGVTSLKMMFSSRKMLSVTVKFSCRYKYSESFSSLPTSIVSPLISCLIFLEFLRFSVHSGNWRNSFSG